MENEKQEALKAKGFHLLMSFMKMRVPFNDPNYVEVEDNFTIMKFETGSVHQNVRLVKNPTMDYGALESGFDIKTQNNGGKGWPSDTIKRVNNYGYRSDDFTSNHEGKHILFLGCSVTWGDGLMEDEVWSKKVYDKISANTKCSGYFNLSFPGTGIIEICQNVSEYIDRFGKPDYIFINFPQLYRFFGVIANATNDGGTEFSLCTSSDDRTTYDNSSERINQTRMNLPAKMLIKYLTIKSIRTLETLCRESGIKLYTFTWDVSGEDNLQDELSEYSLSSFCPEPSNILHEKVFASAQKYDFEFGMKARDKAHFGTYFHDVWADNVLERLKDEDIWV